MELSKENLSDIFLKFQKSTGRKNKEKDTWKQIEGLYAQVEDEVKHNLDICEKLKDIYNRKQFNVTTKYVDLQEKHRELERNFNTLQTELETLSAGHDGDIKMLILQYENSNKLLEKKGKENVTILQKIMEEETSDHTKLVQQLYSDLDLAQATTALHLDEVETELCKELVDINAKIGQMEQIKADVQIELDDLKTRKQRARMPKQSNVIHNLISSESCVASYHQPFPSPVTSAGIKSNNIDLEKKKRNTNLEKSKNEKLCRNRETANIWGHQSEVSKNNNNLNNVNNENNLPKKTVKKRKLFNPDDLEYLNSITLEV